MGFRLLGIACCVAMATTGCNLVFGVEEGMPRPEPPEEAPPIYVTRAELAAAKRRADAGDAPWADAWTALKSSADAALELAPRSVVDDGGGANEEDEHLFATDSPGSAEDCPVNPSGGRADYCAALDMSRAARDLALAYAVTGDGRYADKCVELLQHWFVAEDTAMAPSVSNRGPKDAANGSGSAIEIYLVVPTFVYAASFVRGHAHWQDGAEEAFDAWLSDYLALAKGSQPGAGSQFFYWAASVGAAAAHLEREDDVSLTVSVWQSVIDSTVDADGVIAGAGSPDNGFFMLKGMALTAQLASYHDEDLWSGGALERAFDAYAPCVEGEAMCPEMGTLDIGGLEEGASIYELAYSRYQRHLDVVGAHGRPVRDIRILGVTTFTHGNAFER